MQQINCDANSCSHNKSGICYSNSVDIGGLNASSESGTCCDSFSNKALYSVLTNNANSDSHCDSLSCEVGNCTHNANALCNLQSINVSGLSSQTCTETHCSSFDLKR